MKYANSTISHVYSIHLDPNLRVGPFLFGAATVFSWFQLKCMSEASNKFLKWDGEDDDILNRVRLSGFKVFQLSFAAGKFYDFNGFYERIENENRRKLRNGTNNAEAVLSDGLQKLQYRLIKRAKYETFIQLLVLI
ncbi:hypothetical protein ACTXT7_005995 [Hymenolepis weldensis]